MKNIRFLALLPVLMLSACGLGTKLSDEQAQERIDAIKEKSGSLADDENYQNSKMSLVIDSYNIDTDGTKTKVKQSFKLESNQDGETHAYVEFITGSEKETTDFYLVNYDDSETEDDQIVYVKMYDSEAEDKKEEIVCVSLGKNPSVFSSCVSAFASESSSALLYFAAFANPESVASSFESAAGDQYDTEISYHSGINGDFSVKCVANLKADVEVPDGSEDLVAKQQTTIVTYSKDVLASFDSSSKTVAGDLTSVRGSAAYQKAKIKISLPSGWQNKLDAEDEE